MIPGLLLAASVLAAGLAIPSPAFAVGIDTITISTILATDDVRGWDERLDQVRKELRPLKFKGYRLLGAETRSVDAGDECGIVLPGNRFLQVTTEERLDDRLRMHILLNEKNRPVINTDVDLDADSVVLLGGPRDETGTLIITISADVTSGGGSADGR
jgi:hypothetical protein